MKQVVFVHGGDVMKRKVPVNPKNSEAYQLLFTMAKERGLRMSWSSHKYFQNERFKKHVYFDGKKWKKVRTKSIKPNYIFEKSIFRYSSIPIKEEMAAAVPYLNPIAMQVIASDKMLTHLSFPDVVLPTYRVKNKRHIINALRHIKSRRVVLKPSRGAGGAGVQIVTREKAKSMRLDGPHVMQPFVDSSAGVPGLYKGIHDFRLLFLGNKLFHAFIRTCAPGTLLCNVTQGGTRIVVPLQKVPKELKQIAKGFQSTFGQFENTFYSVDFVYGKEGPKVIEINTTSGLDNAPGYDKHLVQVYTKLIDHIERFV
jgi:glutathione synthase/RimK-type ligase-like ATP-grasp enzyme